MADYMQKYCQTCERVTFWRYPDAETPNKELECTRHSQWLVESA